MLTRYRRARPGRVVDATALFIARRRYHSPRPRLTFETPEGETLTLRRCPTGIVLPLRVRRVIRLGPGLRAWAFS